jgi:hypothetical protein
MAALTQYLWEDYLRNSGKAPFLPQIFILINLNWMLKLKLPKIGIMTILT